MPSEHFKRCDPDNSALHVARSSLYNVLYIHIPDKNWMLIAYKLPHLFLSGDHFKRLYTPRKSGGIQPKVLNLYKC